MAYKVIEAKVTHMVNAKSIRQELHYRLLDNLQELVTAQKHEDAHYTMDYSDTRTMLKQLMRHDASMLRAVQTLEDNGLI